MLNQVVMVGRLVSDKEILETESGKKYTTIKLAVPRSFKNEEGEYETDFIKVNLWGNMAESTVEYCNKGDLIGIKGRIQSENDKIEIVAEKVTFLTSKKDGELDE